MVDGGLELLHDKRTGETQATVPELYLPEEQKIDAALITHAHLDHMGGMLELHEREVFAKNAKIFAAPQTCALMGYVYDDEREHRQYSILDEAILLKQSRVIETPGEFEVLPDIIAYATPAGHIPGAASYILRTSRGRNGLVTGDMCFHDQPVTRGARMMSTYIPESWVPDEVWGTDLTYGPGPKRDLYKEVGRLNFAVKEALQKGHNVVIAAFVIGRGQNIIKWLRRTCRKLNVKLYLDGGGKKVYPIFQKHRWTDRDRDLPEWGVGTGIQFITSNDLRESILSSDEPCVIVTSSGMGDKGPIAYQYIPRLISSKKASFFFTSWLAEGSVGERLVALRGREDEYIEMINEKRERVQYPVNAEIDRFSLSAHASLDEFVDFIDDIVRNCRNGKKLERIVLSHGIHASMIAAQERLRPYTHDMVFGQRGTHLSI